MDVVSDDLLQRLDVRAPRYTSYPPVPRWTERFTTADHSYALAHAGGDAARPLSLYVHIPFCRRRCSYCGCNVVVSKNPTRADRYIDYLAKEVELVARHLGGPRRLARLHLGGGTPTFLDERQLRALWSALTGSGALSIEPGAELAVEIDPTVTSLGQLQLLRELGWNRLSIGVQDLDPAVQEAVGRGQTLDETRAMIEGARALGYGSVNFDLIYGLPRQTASSWQRTLDEVIGLRPDRVAAFSFAWVPEVHPHQRRLPMADMPVGRAKLELLLIARHAFQAAGYRAIGIDHFALPDDELARAQAEGRLWRDFQGYTVLRGGDTLALGVTAIGDTGGAYTQNVRSINEWEKALDAGQLPTARGHHRTDDENDRRRVITEILCNLRVDLGERASRYAPELERLRPMAREGLLSIDGGRVTLTEVGGIFARNVAAVFDSGLTEATAEQCSRAV